MSGLGNLNLSLFNTAAAPAVPDPEVTFTIKKTRSGIGIMVCSHHTAPKEIIERSIIMGLPLFTGPEVLRMKDCSPELVDKIVMAKLAFPGAEVDRLIMEAAA